ncbi:MAG: lactonase family protein [Flavisolibacter sp.]
MKLFVFIASFLICTTVLAQDHYFMLVGTYTNTTSAGIYVYDFNSSDGSSRLIDSARTSNPSYLAVSPNKQFVYSVSEVVRGNNSGQVKAFSFNKKTGHLNLLDGQPSMGDNPCYISVDQTGKWIFVANYSSGSLASLPILKDGSVGPPISSIQHYGHGTNAGRQEAPHVHSTVVAPDNRFLLVSDLGKDKIMLYAIDNKTGALTRAADSAVKLPDGSGPRHFDFHPNKKWGYLIQEMGGTVTAFDYSKGHLRQFQTIRALPAGFTDYFTSADIHVSPDGKFLYASNRDSSNTIAIFKIDQKDGKLSLLGHQSTLGRTPRNFNLDPTGNFLLVANQNSNDIIVFRVNRTTGLLTDTGKRIYVPRPVCVKWAGKR